MKTQSSSFKQEAEKINVQPPRSAWKRIEAQLEADGSRRKFRIARLISYAASIALIAVVGTVGYYYLSSTAKFDSSLYSLSIESLSLEAPSGASIYDVEKVKDLTAYFTEK